MEPVEVAYTENVTNNEIKFFFSYINLYYSF